MNKYISTFSLLVGLLLCLMTDKCVWAQIAENLSSDHQSHVADESAQWLEDSKLGFWVHWGVYSVPAFSGEGTTSEWYGRWMYSDPANPDNKKGHAVAEHHRKTYGDPAEFGYADFIPMFKAEKFDADQWADLFVQGGAKFFTFMAVHHDGFCLWNSKSSPWNSVEMGPKIDFTKELAESVRARGLKFGVADFSQLNFMFYNPLHARQESDVDPRMFGDGNIDPVEAKLGKKLITRPSDSDVDRWLKRAKELCQFEPEIYLFHGRDVEEFAAARAEFIRYYFEQADLWHGKSLNRETGLLTHYGQKSQGSRFVNCGPQNDVKKISDSVWQCNISILSGNDWGYDPATPVKPTNQIVDQFIDVISRRGVLMPSLAPKADGSIPENQKQVLYQLGSWLRINAEAVYGTRPFATFRDADEVRYTRNKENNVLYATMLQWQDEIKLIALRPEYLNVNDIESIRILGTNGPTAWHQDAEGLTIKCPPRPAYRYAYPIKIKVKGFLPTEIEPAAKSYGQVVQVTEDGALLLAENAWLYGYEFRLENSLPEQTNIGWWNSGGDFPEWQVDIEQPGKYDLIVTYSHPGNESAHVLSVNSMAAFQFRLPGTGGWHTPSAANVGTLQFDSKGMHKVTLGEVEDFSWQGINLWSLRLAPSVLAE